MKWYFLAELKKNAPDVYSCWGFLEKLRGGRLAVRFPNDERLAVLDCQRNDARFYADCLSKGLRVRVTGFPFWCGNSRSMTCSVATIWFAGEESELDGLRGKISSP